MNIEEEIFKRYTINISALEKYGFKKNKDIYVYEKLFLNNDFKAIIKVENEKVKGKVIDEEMQEEYLSFRTNTNGKFVNMVREEYKKILIDIRNNCFLKNCFIGNQANRLAYFIKQKYNNEPEFLWKKYKGYGVFRNSYNNKWYGIIMNIDLSKLEDKKGEVEIINIKLNKEDVQKLLTKKGFYKAYHMNKKDWISIILNDTLPDSEIIELLMKSYDLVNGPEYWIIPANPKYYDMINCFNNTKEIMWKQSSDIHVNDIVYIYLGSPYSRVMYKCKATSVNIPYNYSDKNISINKGMKLSLISVLNDKYTFDYLKSKGVKAIRGPRKIDKNVLK